MIEWHSIIGKHYQNRVITEGIQNLKSNQDHVGKNLYLNQAKRKDS